MTEADLKVYTCKEGAERLGSGVIKASTLQRLARLRLVPCTRNGRKVGWTDEQLAGAVGYLADEKPARRRRSQPPKPSTEKRRTETPAPTASTAIEIVSKPGRKYADRGLT